MHRALGLDVLFLRRGRRFRRLRNLDDTRLLEGLDDTRRLDGLRDMREAALHASLRGFANNRSRLRSHRQTLINTGAKINGSGKIEPRDGLRELKYKKCGFVVSL